MAEPHPPRPQRGDGLQTVQLSIEKIYVKDLSLENPGAPQSFQLTEAAAGRSRPAHARRAGRPRRLRMRADASPSPRRSPTRRCSWSRRRRRACSRIRGVAGRAAAADDRDQLPDRAVPVRARSRRRRDDARGLSAGASRADQLRDALPAATGAAAGAAGGRPTRRELDAPSAVARCVRRLAIAAADRWRRRLARPLRTSARRPSARRCSTTRRRPRRSRCSSTAATCRSKCSSPSKAGPRCATCGGAIGWIANKSAGRPAHARRARRRRRRARQPRRGRARGLSRRAERAARACRARGVAEQRRRRPAG